MMNKPWGCTLSGVHTSYAGLGAYKDIQIKITFTNLAVASENFSIYTFWDGGEGTPTNPAKFRFRARFPKPATWRVTAQCMVGTCPSFASFPFNVTSTAYTGTLNPLYSRGPVVQHVYPNNYKALVYKNGPLYTAFPWIGEAVWAAPIRALADTTTWDSYLTNRDSLAKNGKKFTVVQIGPAPGWANPAASASRIPFDTITTSCTVNYRDEESLPNKCSRPKPGFWDKYDNFVRLANEHGMLAWISGIMEPVGGKNSDFTGDDDGLEDDPIDEDRYPLYDPAVVFARYMAARYSGYHVVLSPAFDSIKGYTNEAETQTVVELMKKVGTELNRIAPADTLLSNHWGTASTTEMSQLASETWLNLDLVQSGTSFCSDCAESERLQRVSKRGRTLVPSLLAANSQPPSAAQWRAVVNGEGTYDEGEPIQSLFPPVAPTYHRNAFRQRQVGYLSWMNGSIGFSIGIGGVWDWGLCNLSPQPSFCSKHRPRDLTYRTYADGLTKPSADQHQHFGNMMRKLAPYNGRYSVITTNEQGRIVNQAADSDQKLKMALIRDPRLMHAYLPWNSDIRISKPYSSYVWNVAGNRWFDVRTGEFKANYNSPKVIKCLPGLPCVVDAAYCTSIVPNPCFYCATIDSVDQCAFRNPEPDGAEGSNDYVVEIALTVPGYQSGWAGGSSLDFQGFAGRLENRKGFGVYGEFRDPSSHNLVAEPLRIDSLEFSSFPLNPDFSSDGAGNYVAVWQDDSERDGYQEIYSRTVNANGTLGKVVLVAQTAGADLTSPSVAMDNLGHAFVVWNSRTASASVVEIASIALGATEASSSVVVAGGIDDPAQNPVVASSPLGTIIVAWSSSTPTGDEVVFARLDKDLQLTSPELLLSAAPLGGIVTPVRSFAAANGDVTVEWEALGGDVSAARKARTISGSLRLDQPEVLLEEWEVDGPTAPVDGEDYGSSRWY